MRRSAQCTAWIAALGAALLTACGGGKSGGTESNLPVGGLASSGQVAPAPATAPKVTFYAASRFAEQVSFGATPALVAELQAKGFERWIDEQLAMPFVPIDLKPAEEIYKYASPQDYPWDAVHHFIETSSQRMLTGPDPLRWRVMWSLSQFIATATAFGEPPGWVHWINLLAGHSYGRYGDLLQAVSTDRLMGQFLNNDQNRPKSAECPHCAPNENYARELMQLFSIGVIRLNPDGTPQRDARGRFIETYSQRDVEQLARVLTGWTADLGTDGRPERPGGYWGKPMVPSTWAAERDSGAKTVLGKTFPAGQSAPKDLQDAVGLLMAHPNIGPFVSLRLIQHLVKSDPSPAYLARVAAKFRSNGAGVAGDLKAVVKAVLLDPEARRGDAPGRAQRGDGKVREPMLHNMAVWRAMGCSRLPRFQRDWGVDLLFSQSQQPYNPPSVFSFYAPTDRAPGSNLLAPEQRLLRSPDLSFRLSLTTRGEWRDGKRDVSYLEQAGCKLADTRRAFAAGPEAYMEHLSARFFRGAMPVPLRSLLVHTLTRPDTPFNRNDPDETALALMDTALNTPFFGVMK